VSEDDKSLHEGSGGISGDVGLGLVAGLRSSVSTENTEIWDAVDTLGVTST
jgi:hypothetical protein